MRAERKKGRRQSTREGSQTREEEVRRAKSAFMFFVSENRKKVVDELKGEREGGRGSDGICIDPILSLSSPFHSILFYSILAEKATLVVDGGEATTSSTSNPKPKRRKFKALNHDDDDDDVADDDDDVADIEEDDYSDTAVDPLKVREGRASRSGCL